MGSSDSTPGPKYQRIADELKAAVRAGTYAPGDRLPGENDLMARYGVARMTARQALGVLRSEGIAEARKGSGVYVRAFRTVRRRGIARLAREGWEGGASVWSTDTGDRQLSVDGISVTREELTGEHAAALGGSHAWVRSRRYVLDGSPIMLSVSRLPQDLVDGSPVTGEDPGPGGIYARLADLGHPPERFREEIRCRMPTAAETTALALPAGTPVVLIRRTAMTAAGRVVEVNDMVLDASAYVLEYEFGA